MCRFVVEKLKCYVYISLLSALYCFLSTYVGARRRGIGFKVFFSVGCCFNNQNVMCPLV